MRTCKKRRLKIYKALYEKYRGFSREKESSLREISELTGLKKPDVFNELEEMVKEKRVRKFKKEGKRENFYLLDSEGLIRATHYFELKWDAGLASTSLFSFKQR